MKNSVAVLSKIWNNLHEEDKSKLLLATNPNRSPVQTSLELDLRWKELWPQTQKSLKVINWEIVLGRSL